MTIHTTDKGRIYLTAGEGCWLTNEALYTLGPVYLGKLDSPDNWRDVETPEGYEWRQDEDGSWGLVPIEPEDNPIEPEDAEAE